MPPDGFEGKVTGLLIPPPGRGDPGKAAPGLLGPCPLPTPGLLGRVAGLPGSVAGLEGRVAGLLGVAGRVAGLLLGRVLGAAGRVLGAAGRVFGADGRVRAPLGRRPLLCENPRDLPPPLATAASKDGSSRIRLSGEVPIARAATRNPRKSCFMPITLIRLPPYQRLLHALQFCLLRQPCRSSASSSGQSHRPERR